ncbi:MULTISPECIES: hypothetical protein [unclassified Moraxella]|uniref:hypothetical protein n=1 Tax=unclassified Moraxella TaxID=2685852 RepID=UPI00359D0279
MKNLLKYTLCVTTGLAGVVYAQNPETVSDEMGALSVPRDEMRTTWLDKKRYDTKDYLNKTADKLDRWFGQTDPSNPAYASLRVMADIHWDEYDGTAIKPRVRGKLKLPTLENRLSVVFGDDNLDTDTKGGMHNDGRAITRTNRRFDRRQSRQENSSLGIRWSKFQENKNIETDIDLGVRSDDVYLKMRAGKRWELSQGVNAYFEQMYRYGSKSEHYGRTTLEFSQPQSDSRTLINRTHLHYTHQDVEDLNWANSFYQQHHWSAKYGQREFSYGIYAGGHIENKKVSLNVYGPYASYRQPVWRKWLFLQGDVSYYNNKSENKDHRVGVFGRVEMVF